MASVQPDVMTMSSGEGPCPERSARRADLLTQLRARPLEQCRCCKAVPLVRAARARNLIEPGGGQQFGVRDGPAKRNSRGSAEY